jgi:hypothetical protein
MRNVKGNFVGVKRILQPNNDRSCRQIRSAEIIHLPGQECSLKLICVISWLRSYMRENPC